MLKAILFDAYGTLISTGDGSVRAAGEILALNRRTDIEPAAFYGRWRKLHRQHIDSRAAFLTEGEVFLLDLCQLYREYGLTRDACQDVKVMLVPWGTGRPSRRQERFCGSWGRITLSPSVLPPTRPPY